MNAAARVINQSNLFDGQLADLRLSKHFIMLIMLLFSVLGSALSVIYTTNAYRSSFSQLERAVQQEHHLQMQRGQLILEQASLATPSRVQRLAQDQLGMRLPETKKSFVLLIK